jgi:hypothetical protein
VNGDLRWHWAATLDLVERLNKIQENSVMTADLRAENRNRHEVEMLTTESVYSSLELIFIFISGVHVYYFALISIIHSFSVHCLSLDPCSETLDTSRFLVTTRFCREFPYCYVNVASIHPYIHPSIHPPYPSIHLMALQPKLDLGLLL